MSSTLADEVPGPIRDALDAQWRHIAGPGTWLTGEQRVAVCRQARAARRGDAVDTVELTTPMAEAARRLSSDAPATREAWVRGLYDAGLDPLEYVEILSLVARLAAIDTFAFGIGDTERPLPSPQPGEPSRVRVDGAGFDGAWAPTVGPAGAPSALSAIAAERDAWLELHGALYLSLDEMGRMDIVKDLSRAQLELVAARTSLLNDCFY